MVDIEKLLKKMSIEEKIGQLNLLSYHENIIEDIKAGTVGAVINAYSYEIVYKMQEASLSSPNKIPLLIGDDVIHGFNTTFPVCLGEAASFNLDLIEKSSYYSMLEARESGVNWIYAPMCDLTNDPRWGRIMETSGEDPFLNALVAARKVIGTQTLVDGQITAACAKHYLGYGAVEAGLDYASTEFSEQKMRNYYLSSFKAAIDAGVLSIMNAFTTYINLPVTMNKYLLDDLLRKECGFTGPVVSDWQCLRHLVNFKMVESDEEAALVGLQSGIDIDLNGKVYSRYLLEVIKENPPLIELLDKAVWRVLKMKEKMGLFQNPLPKKNPKPLSLEIRKHAQKAADEAIILFKNEDNILPLPQEAKILVIGAYNDDQDIHLGAWSSRGLKENNISLRQGLSKVFKNIIFYNTPEDSSKTNWKELKEATKGIDYILLALGEPRYMSGENNCRMTINLPFNQELLVDYISDLKLPFIGLVMAGRPLTITNLHQKAKAIIWSFHLGCEAGNSIARVLSGLVNPSAKTTVTFPKTLGQVPIYYNRYPYGRPDIAHYLDGEMEPLYHFGFGLSYANFIYSDFDYQYQNGRLTIDLEIENKSSYDGKEIVQVYIIPELMKTLVPNKQLIGFWKGEIKAGSKRSVHIEMTPDVSQLRKSFNVMVGPSSQKGIVKRVLLDN